MKPSLCFLLIWVSPAVFAAGLDADGGQAAALYQQTDYEGSLRVLVLQKSPGAEAYSLIGKNNFMLGKYKDAADAFRRAAALDPKNAEYILWLGRTQGRRAEKASVFSAPGLASEARQEFEKAVALDPNYREALNDLFSFYLDAPGFIGGGLDKAESVAQRTRPLSAAEYEFDEAQIALKRKNPAAAEAHLKRAFELAPQPGRAVDLARFYARQGRLAESDSWFDRAERIEPRRPATTFARAQAAIETGRVEQGQALLQIYLQFRITPDDPPREDARRLLRRTGDPQLTSKVG